MNNNFILLLCLIFLGSMVPTTTNAFTCTIGYGGNNTVQISPPNANDLKLNSFFSVMDMSSITCYGNERDNLRISSASIDSRLSAYGLTGVLNVDGTRFDLPTSGQYIWPYPNSTAALTKGYATFPIKVKFELKRNTTGAWTTGVTLPAGTTIATLRAEQRSNTSWSQNTTWDFVLRAPLVIPPYTCNVTTPENRTITLPNTDATALRARSKGRIEDSKTHFSINLDCEALSTIKLTIDGTTMEGKTDVLANQESGLNNIGIQIIPRNISTPLTFDSQIVTLTEFASTSEILDFDAYYYFNGGRVQPGKVRASMTYTFSYE